MVEPVLGKAWVVGTDVGGVVEIDPPGVVRDLADSRRVVRRRRGGQLALPLGELAQHVVHRRVRVFEGQQQRAEAPHGGRGGHRLGKGRLAESGVMAHASLSFTGFRPAISVGGVSLLTYTA